MLEKPLERLLFACRWLLAPLYLRLALGLVVLATITQLGESDCASS